MFFPLIEQQQHLYFSNRSHCHGHSDTVGTMSFYPERFASDVIITAALHGLYTRVGDEAKGVLTEVTKTDYEEEHGQTSTA